MATYCGYNETNMLFVLNQRCEVVTLEKAGDFEWRLYCRCETHGEFEETGTLFAVLMHAFRPHLEWADKHRAAWRAAFEEGMKAAQAETP